MANNIRISSHRLLGVVKLIPYETIVTLRYPRRGGYTVDPGGVITHELHLKGRTILGAEQVVAERGVDVGLYIDFAACSAFDRPSNSRVFVFEEEIYYILTYSDVLYSGHGKQSGLRRMRNNNIVYYLNRVSNARHYSLIMNSITEIWRNGGQKD